MLCNLTGTNKRMNEANCYCYMFAVRNDKRRRCLNVLDLKIEMQTTHVHIRHVGSLEHIVWRVAVRVIPWKNSERNIYRLNGFSVVYFFDCIICDVIPAASLAFAPTAIRDKWMNILQVHKNYLSCYQQPNARRTDLPTVHIYVVFPASTTTAAKIGTQSSTYRILYDRYQNLKLNNVVLVFFGARKHFTWREMRPNRETRRAKEGRRIQCDSLITMGSKIHRITCIIILVSLFIFKITIHCSLEWPTFVGVTDTNKKAAQRFCNQSASWFSHSLGLAEAYAAGQNCRIVVKTAWRMHSFVYCVFCSEAPTLAMPAASLYCICMQIEVDHLAACKHIRPHGLECAFHSFGRWFGAWRRNTFSRLSLFAQSGDGGSWLNESAFKCTRIAVLFQRSKLYNSLNFCVWQHASLLNEIKSISYALESIRGSQSEINTICQVNSHHGKIKSSNVAIIPVFLWPGLAHCLFDKFQFILVSMKRKNPISIRNAIYSFLRMICIICINIYVEHI